VACDQDYPGMADLMHDQDPAKLSVNICDNLNDQKNNLKSFEKYKQCLQVIDWTNFPMMEHFMHIGLMSAFSKLCQNFALGVSLMFGKEN
jgi:hypothetical protein